MDTNLNLSVIILTLNEEIHIERCVENARRFADEIFVVDCFSTDRTVEIAERLGATVVQHAWPGNQAEQFNWALDNLPLRTRWILRLDADEYLPDATIREIGELLPKADESVLGFIMPLSHKFLGRWIRHGTNKVVLLRLFRRGAARCEVRLMDEHIALERGGEIISLHSGFVDDNLNELGWWTRKHIGYAVREAATLLDREFSLTSSSLDTGGKIIEQASATRRQKGMYARMPLFWRAFGYFCYRYFLRLGFLDGKEGFLWHFLQGWWYRTLVDAKVFEIKKACGNDPEKIRTCLSEQYHITLK